MNSIIIMLIYIYIYIYIYIESARTTDKNSIRKTEIDLLQMSGNKNKHPLKFEISIRYSDSVHKVTKYRLAPYLFILFYALEDL